MDYRLLLVHAAGEHMADHGREEYLNALVSNKHSETPVADRHNVHS